MKDRKGVAVLPGDIIWIGRRKRELGELVAREVVRVLADRLEVRGVARFPDSHMYSHMFKATPTKLAHYIGTNFIVDVAERYVEPMGLPEAWRVAPASST